MPLERLKKKISEENEKKKQEVIQEMEKNFWNSMQHGTDNVYTYSAEKVNLTPFKPSYKPLFELLDAIEDEEFKEAFRRAIIEQYINPDEEFKRLSGAINRIIWEDTEEGSEYWDKYYCMAEMYDKI